MEHIKQEIPEAARNSHRLVTLATAARETGITRKRLRAAVSDGTLPAYQIGAWLRIRLVDIDQWLKDRRYPALDKGMR
jgi:excisionase family DNA binding protein